MSELAMDFEKIYLKDYAILGLKDSNKRDIRKPSVLSLLATFLDRSVQKNEQVLENTKIEDAITVFHGLRAPSLSIRQYIDRIFKYSCCSPSCFVIGQVYIDRFINQTSSRITYLNIHRLLVTGIMVAAKFMDDSFYNNAYYARVGGISTSELNKLERNFLFGLDFNLYVSVETFGVYCSVLKRETLNEPGIERMIQSCGVEESWESRDDSSRAQSTAT